MTISPSTASSGYRLQTTIHQHKHLAIPLHLPTHRLRDAAHKTLRAQLHNHCAWEDTLHTPPDPSDLPCACSHLHTLLLDPATVTTNDHYILTLDQLTLPHLRIFLAANMNSTFYPSKARYFLTFQTAFKWLRIQGLPTSLTQHSEPFLQHQWRLHTAHLKQQPRFTARLLRQLQEYLGDKVALHHADHELQQLRIPKGAACLYLSALQAGGDRVAAWLSPTKLHAVDQDAGTDHPCVPALSTVDHAVSFAWFVSWSFHVSSPKPTFLQLCSPPHRLCRSISRPLRNNVQPYCSC